MIDHFSPYCPWRHLNSGKSPPLATLLCHRSPLLIGKTGRSYGRPSHHVCRYGCRPRNKTGIIPYNAWKYKDSIVLVWHYLGVLPRFLCNGKCLLCRPRSRGWRCPGFRCFSRPRWERSGRCRTCNSAKCHLGDVFGGFCREPPRKAWKIIILSYFIKNSSFLNSGEIFIGKVV